MDDGLLENLQAKFSELFKNLKSLREQRETVEEDNQHLLKLIGEEEEQLELSDESDDDEELYQECQKRVQGLMEKKKISDMQTKEENNLKSQLYMHMETIQSEIVQMKSGIEQQKQSQIDLSQRIEDTTLKIDDYQNKIEKAQLSLEQQGSLLNEELEKGIQENDKVKQIQNEVRMQLYTNSLAEKRINELEKEIAKFWDEIKKKNQRISVLKNNQNIMIQKIQKSIKTETIYNRLKDENTVLAQENIQIREKLNQLINSIPQAMKKKGINKQKLNQKEFLDYYDDSICQNQIKVRNLEKVREEHQNNINSLQCEIQSLEDKYNQMTSNIKGLQEQYFQLEQSSKEFNSDDYIKQNYPNYHEVKRKSEKK